MAPVEDENGAMGGRVVDVLLDRDRVGHGIVRVHDTLLHWAHLRADLHSLPHGQFRHPQGESPPRLWPATRREQIILASAHIAFGSIGVRGCSMENGDVNIYVEQTLGFVQQQYRRTSQARTRQYSRGVCRILSVARNVQLVFSVSENSLPSSAATVS